MSLRLYCNRFMHFKDVLVCAVNCPFRTRCADFALFYDAHREDVDGVVENYYARRRETKLISIAPVAPMQTLIKLEVKRELDATFIWINTDDRAETLTQEDVIKRAEQGQKAKHIFRIAQEMELKFQLVPRRQIDKVKRNLQTEQERTAARAAARTNAHAATRLRALQNDADVADESFAPAFSETSVATETVAAPRRRRRA